MIHNCHVFVGKVGLLTHVHDHVRIRRVSRVLVCFQLFLTSQYLPVHICQVPRLFLYILMFSFASYQGSRFTFSFMSTVIICAHTDHASGTQGLIVLCVQNSLLPSWWSGSLFTHCCGSLMSPFSRNRRIQVISGWRFSVLYYASYLLTYLPTYFLACLLSYFCLLA